MKPFCCELLVCGLQQQQQQQHNLRWETALVNFTYALFVCVTTCIRADFTS
jgi:hypothetical protein